MMKPVSPAPGSPAPPRSVLFVEKVFLRRKKDEPLRGVELFNVTVAGDLVRQGHEVYMPVAHSWAHPLREEFGKDAPRLLPVPDTGVDVITTLLAALRAVRRPCHVLLLGNVGKSLLPLIDLLRARGSFARCVLIAHREATPRFARRLSALPGHVVAVNEQIARPFREHGHPRVHVDYGVVRADRFHPPGAPLIRPDDLVRFVVFGALDNAWKGADTAAAAFEALPESRQARAELHLASYTLPPKFRNSRIIAYSWIDNNKTPEFLRNMDVMLVPSRDEEVMRETFSQVMVQGMLTGLPIIAHDLPVLAEKLDAGGGRLFRTPEGLVKAMTEMITRPETRLALGEQARRTALERYVWDTGRFVERYFTT